MNGEYRRNIVLIGLSGSGKTSLGQRLARKMKRVLLDTDAMVESHAGRTVTEIFSQDGETVFRDLETQCIREAAAYEKAIIVTGGGAILRKENMEILSQNGLFFFIDRHPSRILRTSSLDDRPLVKGKKNSLFMLYGERLPLYRKWANFRIDNSKRLKQAMLAVIKKYKQAENQHEISCH